MLTPIANITIAEGCTAISANGNVYTVSYDGGDGKTEKANAVIPTVKNGTLTVPAGSDVIWCGVMQDVERIVLCPEFTDVFSLGDMFPNASEITMEGDGKGPIHTYDNALYAVIDGKIGLVYVPAMHSETLNIENGTYGVADSVLYGLKNVEKIVIPETLEITMGHNLAECPALKEIDVSANDRFVFEKGVLMDSSRETVLGVVENAPEIFIPKTVKECEFYLNRVESDITMERFDIDNFEVMYGFGGRIICGPGSECMTDDSGLVYTADGRFVVGYIHENDRTILPDTVLAVRDKVLKNNYDAIVLPDGLKAFYGDFAMNHRVYIPDSLEYYNDTNCTFLDKDGNLMDPDAELIRGHWYDPLNDYTVIQSDPSDGDGGSGDNNTLLYVGIGVGAVVVLLAGILIWRSRQ